MPKRPTRFLEPLAKRIALLPPWTALAIVWIVPPTLAILVLEFVPESLIPIVAGAVVGHGIYLLSPVAIVVHLAGHPGMLYRPRPVLLVLSYVGVVVLWIFLEPIVRFLETSHSIVHVIGMIFVAAVTCSPFFIIWSAARALTSLEDESSYWTRRTVFTFFQIFYLPFTIWFIQKRVRKIDVTGWCSGPDINTTANANQM